METRKRTSTQRVSTIVEGKPKREGSSQKPAKLTLKPSSPSSAHPTPRPTPSPSKKTKRSSPLEECAQLETSEDIVKHLLTINDSHLPDLLGTFSESVRLLRDLWRAHRGSVAICSVVTRLLSCLVVQSDSLPQHLHDFILSLPEHEDVVVKSIGLKCIQQIAEHFSNKLDFSQSALQLALKEIHSTHHAVRVECLKLIGHLSHVTVEDVEGPLAVLEEKCNDSDPRVRTAAFEALFLIHQKKEKKLPLSIYYRASEALSDDSEDVRVVAVQLVWALGLENRDQVVPLKQDSTLEMRLADDAFVKICDMINDISMSVRALAAGLLGDFQGISHKFLEQTLDKKLMSHLRVVKSDHERQRELHAGGGGSRDWDSGSKWDTSVPKMELDPSEVSLMSAGACGAFVHGLEDEFMEVRSAAVESMCQLGASCPQFAAQSLDFLVDMFNDEIQSVRLKAINSLQRVSENIQLREDQLETILGALEESSVEIREALHALLSSCRITTSRGLNSTIHSLLDNLKKYPSDKQSVWRCLKHLGSNHGALVSTLVPGLLSTHPFFMGKEPDVDDPAYICILILVFNAVPRCPTIPAHFPAHVFRQYTYLRDTLPELIPWIRVGMPAVVKLGRANRTGNSEARSFLHQILLRAHTASGDRESHHVWQTCISDLQRVSELSPPLSAIAQCSATFLQCQLLMGKVAEVLSQDLMLLSECPGQTGLSHTLATIRELLLLSYRLEHTFTNLGPQLVQKARLVRASAHAMLLLVAVQTDFDTEQTDNFIEMKRLFRERLMEIEKFSDSHSLPLPPILTPLTKMDVTTAAVDVLAQALQPLVKANFCASVSLPDLLGVCQSRADILEPFESGKEDFTKFVASLALSVPTAATLHNVTDPGRVAIQVKFPDGRHLLFSPKPSDLRQVDARERKLRSEFVISHGVWTDPCQLELSVVLRYSPDIKEDSCFHLLQALHKPVPVGSVSSPVHSHSEDSMGHDTLTERNVLVISEVVQINVHPMESTSKSFNVFA